MEYFSIIKNRVLDLKTNPDIPAMQQNIACYYHPGAAIIFTGRDNQAMSEFSQNLKRIRINKGLTQDQLAEKLNVTRQAVSNWENDRTEPDIEMMNAMAACLGIDISELINGPKAPAYQPKQKKYIVVSIILGLIVIAGLAAMIWIKPGLVLQFSSFNTKPLMTYNMLFRPVCFAAAGALLPCLISLQKNTMINNSAFRLALLIIGIILLIPPLVTGLQFALWNQTNGSSLNLLFPFVWRVSESGLNMYYRVMPFIAGVLLFLGINKNHI